MTQTQKTTVLLSLSDVSRLCRQETTFSSISDLIIAASDYGVKSVVLAGFPEEGAYTELQPELSGDQRLTAFRNSG